MINAILKGIMSMIIGLVSIVLAPIDLVISSSLPVLDNALEAVNQLFQTIINGLAWGTSFLGLSNEALSLIVSYYIFKLTLPIAVSAVKGALKWYNILKP